MHRLALIDHDMQKVDGTHGSKYHYYNACADQLALSIASIMCIHSACNSSMCVVHPAVISIA